MYKTCTYYVFLSYRNLTELDIQENGMDDLGGGWLSCFSENCSSLEVLNFASLNSEVSFDALEKLVRRCKSLRILKVNKSITLDQLQQLLVLAPQLIELGTGSFQQELTPLQYEGLGIAFSNCKNLQTLSGFWEDTSLHLPVLYSACPSLTFLNLSYATLRSGELAKIVAHSPNIRRLWVRTRHLRFFLWANFGIKLRFIPLISGSFIYL